MGPEDYLLLGADRVKDKNILEPAYNDSRGITAAFILNVFRNVNRRLKILYGEEFGLTIEETARGSILARIALPLSRDDA